MTAQFTKQGVRFSTFLVLALLFPGVLCDELEWVDPAWAIAQRVQSKASAARDAFLKGSDTRSKGGPWSITNSTILAPNGNAYEYVSWAPYHWPDCQWCSNKRDIYEDYIPHDNVQPVENKNSVNTKRFQRRNTTPVKPSVGTKAQLPPTSTRAKVPTETNPPSSEDTPDNTGASASRNGKDTNSDADNLNDQPGPKQQSATKTKGTSCTPSPARMAPSATWTTCDYITKDGKRNPDVDLAVDSGFINDMPIAVLYNAIAFATSGTLSFATRATSFIDMFFLNSDTAMNPSLMYAQMIRGPGASTGQHMGILDARGFVSVVNSVLILKMASNPAWTPLKDKGMQKWATGYLGWLITSPLGHQAASSPNNHGTFWMAQVAAFKFYLGDIKGVRQTINYYLTHQFQDQIAASGDQPFEAVRTRPFHYRCFNLEAMIVLAKLGDQVGMDVWKARSRYGATIQDVANFMIHPGRNNLAEDPTQLNPHLAAVTVAYGDPTGAYAKYIKTSDTSYARRPYSFYDQPGAFGHEAPPPAPTTSTEAPKMSGHPQQAPEARMKKRYSTLDKSHAESGRERKHESWASWAHTGGWFQHKTLIPLYVRSTEYSDPTGSASASTDSGFVTATVTPKWHEGQDPIRPEIFNMQSSVQLDDDAFATWDDIRPYYVVDLPADAVAAGEARKWRSVPRERSTSSRWRRAH